MSVRATDVVCTKHPRKLPELSYKVCVRCGAVWNVSRFMDRKTYVCPKCARGRKEV